MPFLVNSGVLKMSCEISVSIVHQKRRVRIDANVGGLLVYNACIL